MAVEKGEEKLKRGVARLVEKQESVKQIKSVEENLKKSTINIHLKKMDVY